MTVTLSRSAKFRPPPTPALSARRTRSCCACPRRSASTSSRTCRYVVAATEMVAAHLRRGQLVVLESTTYPGTTRGRGAADPREERPASAARTSSSPSAPSARTRAARPHDTRTIPKLVGGVDEPQHASSRRRSTARRWCRRPPGRLRRDRRGRQAAGEHLPGRQHRPGQRAEGAADRDGHRRLEGDRRRGDQAVRLPGVLPGARPGRPLHPDRPVLPDLEGARGRATTRASSSWPARSTRSMPRLRGAPHGRGTERARQGAARRDACWWSASPTSRTSTTSVRPRRRRSSSACSELGAEVSYHDPHVPDVPRHAQALDRDLESVPLTAERGRAADCVLVVTDHQADRLASHRRPRTLGRRHPQRDGPVRAARGSARPGLIGGPPRRSGPKRARGRSRTGAILSRP